MLAGWPAQGQLAQDRRWKRVALGPSQWGLGGRDAAELGQRAKQSRRPEAGRPLAAWAPVAMVGVCRPPCPIG